MLNTTTRWHSSLTPRVGELVLLLAATAAVLGGVGCKPSNATAPNTGTLTVTITAPAGATPNVMVSGPGGYGKVLSATTALTGLAAGSYTVTAASVTTPAPIIGTVNTATVSGSPASVTVGATAAATATYVQRPGSGGLWIGNIVESVVHYTAGQLRGTTSAPPTTDIKTGESNYGIAFDANGNLWVALFGNSTVVEYTARQLSASGILTPAVILTSNNGSMSAPVALAFDASGNLWVANYGSYAVVEFAVGQLGSSGSPAPAVAISSSNGSLSAPLGLAFDAAGNLWVANGGDSSVVEFASSQLVVSGSPTPAVIISASNGSLSMPFGLAFDAGGDLWVANETAKTVVEFTPGQVTASGIPTPTITLSSTGGLYAPAGLAFDASGNLWVADYADVVEFAASQLVVSGTVTPAVALTSGSLFKSFGIAFDPHAANLPLR